MWPSCLSLLLLLCSIFLLPSINAANQANILQELIKSKRTSAASEHDKSWEEMFSTKSFSPVSISAQHGSMKADKIIRLPGQPKDVDFDQYAGYVTVDPSHGRALFYYFVESPWFSASKPLVLWLNGGPGCSSLGYGAMQELGPFRVNSDNKTLTRNYNAWNKVANVLFLETPAGVGFSYSNTSSDIDESGDERTAADNYAFLVNWLERFPQYKNRDLFITGENYAGHYIPELAYLILQNNKITNQTVINLRGVAIGNAYVDQVYNDLGTYEYYWNHALISDETYSLIRSTCNFMSKVYDKKCNDALGNVNIGAIDRSNIYAPICGGSKRYSAAGGLGETDPCVRYYVSPYLNNPAVQQALHADATKLPFGWRSCRAIAWKDGPDTMLPIIKNLTASGIRFWLYSGDLDSVVPITATRYFIKLLGLPIKTPWRPWYHNQQVGGFVQEYNGLTLVTVRGSGHAVPSDQPTRALAMISSFLNGELPPPRIWLPPPKTVIQS